MSAKQVSPPSGGSVTACRMVASDGSGRNDLSLCQACESDLAAGQAVGIQVGDGVHQGIVGAAIAGDVPLQRAELLGEGDLLVLVQRLVAKAQHVVANEGGVDRVARRGVERLAQVQPDDFRSKQWGKRPHGEVLAGLRGGLQEPSTCARSS